MVLVRLLLLLRRRQSDALGGLSLSPERRWGAQTGRGYAGVTRPALPPSYDDYDYGEVNQLLERSLKIYIKTVACYPEKTTKRTYTQFWRHFKHSEKVLTHILPS